MKNRIKRLSKPVRDEIRLNNSKLNRNKAVLPHLQLKSLRRLVLYLSALAACFAILNNSIGVWQKIQPFQGNEYVESSPSVTIYQIHLNPDSDNSKRTKLGELSKLDQ